MTGSGEPPTVLVTGATGFIGRHVIAPLLRGGAVVHAVSRGRRELPGVRTWACDLFDRQRTRDVVAAVRPTHLLHLAWEATPGRFWTSPDNLDWVAASLHLVRAFAEAGGKRVVAAGTCAEYDWTVGDGTFREDHPTNPSTLYGAAKDATRRVVQAYCEGTGLSWAWGRVFNPYGPGEPAGKLVGSVINALARGEPARCSAGTQVRDYLHVEDVANAFFRLLISDVLGGVNIGSGIGTSVGEVAKKLGELAGRPDLIRLGELPTRADEPLRVVADVRRLTAEVGWRPRFDIRSGVADTLAASTLEGVMIGHDAADELGSGR